MQNHQNFILVESNLITITITLKTQIKALITLTTEKLNGLKSTLAEKCYQEECITLWQQQCLYLVSMITEQLLLTCFVIHIKMMMTLLTML